MERILPGVLHWTTIHERWGIEISSYLLEEERVLIDPGIPEEGLEWFAEHGPPVAALLTNRHHYRHAGTFAERFGATVHASRLGMQAFTSGEPVTPFSGGDELPGGVLAIEVGGICADETALLMPAHRAVAVADGVVRMPPDSPLGFVPDQLMHDPERTKARLAEGYRRVLGHDWDHLLLAHGNPVVGDGRKALAEFVASA